MCARCTCMAQGEREPLSHACSAPDRSQSRKGCCPDRLSLPRVLDGTWDARRGSERARRGTSAERCAAGATRGPCTASALLLDELALAASHPASCCSSASPSGRSPSAAQLERSRSATASGPGLWSSARVHPRPRCAAACRRGHLLRKSKKPQKDSRNRVRARARGAAGRPSCPTRPEALASATVSRQRSLAEAGQGRPVADEPLLECTQRHRTNVEGVAASRVGKRQSRGRLEGGSARSRGSVVDAVERLSARMLLRG